MLKIGEKIKKLRELKGFTPKDIAEKLSMTHQGYLKIENNSVDVNTEKLAKIAQVLEIELGDLFNFDEKAALSNFFNNTNNNQEVNNTLFALHETPDITVALYEKLIAEKDVMLADKNAEILYLRGLVSGFVDKK